jgi:hypothetical protein
LFKEFLKGVKFMETNKSSPGSPLKNEKYLSRPKLAHYALLFTWLFLFAGMLAATLNRHGTIGEFVGFLVVSGFFLETLWTDLRNK